MSHLVPKYRPMSHDRSPHPCRPGQICLTRELIGARVYRLPEGLPPGVRVRTLGYDHGYWEVHELDAPERTWTVYLILLEVVVNRDR